MVGTASPEFKDTISLGLLEVSAYRRTLDGDGYNVPGALGATESLKKNSSGLDRFRNSIAWSSLKINAECSLKKL